MYRYGVLGHGVLKLLFSLLMFTTITNADSLFTQIKHPLTSNSEFTREELALKTPANSPLRHFGSNHIRTVGVDTEICGASGFDVKNLTLADYWQFEHSGQCLTNVTKCTYLMTFCKRLVISTTGCSNASVCQKSENNDDVKLSSYTANPFRTNNTQNGFVASFLNGSTYTTDQGKACNISVLINFECKRTAIWTPQVNQGVLTPSIVPGNVDVKYFPSTCLYIFRLDYEGACHKITPADIVPGLSAGTVIIIIFVVSLSVYFICGIIVNALRGEKGVEMLPNSDFWKMLPVWIKAGWDYTCRCECSKDTSTGYDSI